MTKKNPIDIIRPIIQQYALAHDEEGGDIALHALDRGVQWKDLLDERELKEVEFAGVYADLFGHGTAGHNRLMLIAKMNTLLGIYEEALHALVEYVETGEL